MKKAILLLLAAMLLLCLCACGQDEPISTTTAPAGIVKPTGTPTEPTVAPTEPAGCAHNYTAVVTEPACTEGGFTTYTCGLCGESYVDDRIAATGHSWKNATCTEAKTCTICAAVEGETIGHSFVEGICEICGEKDPDYIAPVSVKTQLAELENTIVEDVETTISSLQTSWETLKAEITTYELYMSNIERIEQFYEEVYQNIEALCFRKYEYALSYAEIIVLSNETFWDKYEYLDEIYDVVYSDVGDEVYDEIYDGILDEIYDTFYDGILKDAEDYLPYSEWADLRSNEYRLWSDTHSDVYGENSDSASDVYSFCSDIGSEIFSRNEERALRILEKFRAKILRIKNGSGITYNSHPNLASVTTLKELEALIEQDTSATIASLAAEWAVLKTEINTIEKYNSSVNQVEQFYEKVYSTVEQLMFRQYEYTLFYAKLIMNSDNSLLEKYDMMQDVYNCIYDDSCDEIYDEIYEELLEDMYDTFYEGIIKNAEDDMAYSQWANIWSDEYAMWSGTRSDVYDQWRQARSDIYDFFLDIRGALWKKDDIKAKEEIVAFEKLFKTISRQIME